MWEKMGLIVGRPRAGGAGTSNDGNSARRAFSEEKTFAEVTGVSEDLIRRLHIILQVMACGHQIDPHKFKGFCDETADLIVHLFEWYYMPVSVHKVLVHGPAVVEALPLPLGKLSEEAQEARNKDVRAYRLHNARKDSRLHTMMDQFGFLLVTSDPLISSVYLARRCRKGARARSQLHHEAISLLRPDLSDDSDSDGE